MVNYLCHNNLINRSLSSNTFAYCETTFRVNIPFGDFQLSAQLISHFLFNGFRNSLDGDSFLIKVFRPFVSRKAASAL